MISEKVRCTFWVRASSSGDCSMLLGQLLDAGDEVGLLGDVGAEADAVCRPGRGCGCCRRASSASAPRPPPRRRRRACRGPARRPRGRATRPPRASGCRRGCRPPASPTAAGRPRAGSACPGRRRSRAAAAPAAPAAASRPSRAAGPARPIRRPPGPASRRGSGGRAAQPRSIGTRLEVRTFSRSGSSIRRNPSS